ncbi:hypothetical protein, partial [Neobacillus drentensis]|uniref:hypothetical protein n=1 Tax=Neobacillus drentensis TaxID=220684 RepID=UPI002FFFDCDA
SVTIGAGRCPRRRTQYSLGANGQKDAYIVVKLKSVQSTRTEKGYRIFRQPAKSPSRAFLS